MSNRLALTSAASPIPRVGVYRILVCRPNHRLGNMLLMTPLIAELERLFKGAEIDIVAEGEAARDIFSAYFSVRHVFCLPRLGFKHPIQFLRVLRQIRRHHYDLVIDPCVGSNFSRVLTRLCHGRSKLGYDLRPAAPGLTHTVSPEIAPKHMAQRPLGLLHGPAEAGLAHYPRLDLRLSEAERIAGQHTLRELLATTPHPATRVIGIYAEATGNKRYQSAWWLAFIEALQAMAPDCQIIELVPAHGRSMLGSAWPAYYSSHLRRMASVMAAVDLMISADCGVMHLAVAAQVSTAGLFCASNAERYGPYGGLNSVLVTHELSPSEVARRVAHAHPAIFPALPMPAADPVLAPLELGLPVINAI